jgi:hypothetical protein
LWEEDSIGSNDWEHSLPKSDNSKRVKVFEIFSRCRPISNLAHIITGLRELKFVKKKEGWNHLKLFSKSIEPEKFSYIQQNELK